MSTMLDKINTFIKDTAKQIVDIPDELEVTSSLSTKAIIVQVRVNQSDCGKIIGRQGKTIDALKVLCLAIKNTNFPDDSRRIMLEVLEDEESSFRYN